MRRMYQPGLQHCWVLVQWHISHMYGSEHQRRAVHPRWHHIAVRYFHQFILQPALTTAPNSTLSGTGISSYVYDDFAALTGLTNLFVPARAS